MSGRGFSERDRFILIVTTFRGSLGETESIAIKARKIKGALKVDSSICAQSKLFSKEIRSRINTRKP
jgi:hypothetical protein